MSELGKVIDHIAVEALGDPLKAAGFRRSGRTWRRQMGDAVQVVHVQASRYNAGRDGEFVLKAGVYFPALASPARTLPAHRHPRRGGLPGAHSADAAGPELVEGAGRQRGAARTGRGTSPWGSVLLAGSPGPIGRPGKPTRGRRRICGRAFDTAGRALPNPAGFYCAMRVDSTLGP